MRFNDFWQRYFANVRWTELALATGGAIIGSMQAQTATGSPLDKATVLKAVGVGVSVAWAYLRMPKQETPPVPHALTEESEIGLPDGVDSTGPAHDVGEEIVIGVVNKALGPVAAAAPDLANNIVDELKRVLVRGIRWGRR